MRTYTYRGKFVSAANEHTYTLEVNCNGFLQAFFLLTADAIRSGKHYQLATITNVDQGGTKTVDNIIKATSLLK